jgi:hypothetical protein
MKVFLNNFNGILDDLIPAIGQNLTADWKEADVVVLWQDVMGELENIASQAKAMGKKVIVAEHGLLSINDYIPPLRRPLVADKFMAWGNWTKDWLLEKTDIDPQKIVVTGTLLTNKIISRRKHPDKRVLFAPRHWNGEIQENIDVANELKGCKYTVFSKILKGENDPASYPNPLSTDRQGLNHIDTCFDVLSWADVVVGIGEGTFGALTHLMDIPYISVDNWRQKDLLGKTYTEKAFKKQISKACFSVPIEMLNEQIDMLIKNPHLGFRNRKWFREEALNLPCDPLKNMMEVING